MISFLFPVFLVSFFIFGCKKLLKITHIEPVGMIYLSYDHENECINNNNTIDYFKE